MKKILLGTLLIGAMFGKAIAQEVSVDWGTSFDAKTEVQKIIGEQDEVMYVFSKKGKKTFLQGFTGEQNDLKFSEQFLLPEYNGEKTTVIDMVMTDVGPLAIGYQYSKKTGKVKVYGQKFTLGGKIQGKGIVILETVNRVKVKNNKVVIDLSRDKSKIMFTYMRNEKKEDILHADIVVISNDLDVLSTRTVDHSFEEAKGEDRFFQYEVHLDNDGSYISSVQEAIYRKNEMPDYSFTIRDFDSEGEQVAEKTINFQDKGIYKPYIFFDEKENSFRVVGMYAEFKGKKNRIPGYSGVYSAVIERGSLDVLEKQSTVFPDEFLKKFYSEKKIAKANSKDKNLYVSSGFGIDHVFITGEGNMIVSAEYYTKERKQDSKGNYYTVWTFGAIMVMSINPEGELNWINHVPKYQVTSVRDLPIGLGGITISIKMAEPKILNNWSYVPGLGENHFYILFNDHRKNTGEEKEGKSKALVNPKKSIPFKITMDLESGKFTKEAMISGEQEETYMAPRVIHRIADNEFVVWAVKRKENKFGRVKFE